MAANFTVCLCTANSGLTERFTPAMVKEGPGPKAARENGKQQPG
jgi:hypothetical protein